MLKNNVILVVNPVSGGIDKAALIEQVSHYARFLKLTLYCYETSGINDLQAIREFYALHRPERVLIAGGDGTIKLVAEALEDKEVVFGILPVGSSNGLATDLGLMLSEEEYIAIAFQNHHVSIDYITINDRMCLHLSDLGLNAELIKNYDKSAIRGKLGYALQVFNTLWHAEKSFLVRIKTNQELIETRARMLVIANSQKYGTGVTINPIGIMSDGKLELVILKRITFYIFCKIVMGKIQTIMQDVVIISTDKAQISIDRPVSFQIDGEFCGKESNLDVRISSKKLKIAVARV
ncbi:diacylglycerol kinase [Flavobacterium sp. L1I52]|uniref:Diacylglycerol kinase n=1 Tax=Flavobacterium pokkalii TaxID=1940408 RepID=A0ABR7UMZ4_9FLAO|nr:diacylglycerol kinase family protein [Flavobacterium pokkalii]MBD0724104.1 diacylglycerol kinase [Flavobacterium pokkalii]